MAHLYGNMERKRLSGLLIVGWLASRRLVMKAIDHNKTKARKIVSERLQRFFVALNDQIANGTEELWQRVESRLASAPPAKADGA
jgi:hypothetical protein